MKSKLLQKTIALLCVITCSLGVVACGGSGQGGSVADTEETLSIYIADSGYSTEWCDSMLELFKKQDWVKEKYPNLVIDPDHNSDYSISGYEYVMNGASQCDYDLIATLSDGGNYYATKAKDGTYYFEELSYVYDMQVPGENVTLKEKVDERWYDMQQTEMLDGTIKYFSVPYLNSSMGLLYNENVLKRAFGENYEMPKTTDELYAFCEDLVEKGEVPIVSCANEHYWSTMFPVWWAQYEGIEEYKNYWYGTKDGKFDSSVTQQEGRKYSLMVLDSLLNAGNGFIHPDSTIKDFMFMQRYFIAGMGAFTCNGDWFTAEMSENTDHIRWMKTPVISYITQKCTTVTTDEQLSAVVGYVDENMGFEQAAQKYGEDGYGTLAKADFERIYEARNAVFARGGAHFSIPSYAKGKQVAIDFIRFCATDIAIEAMMDATRGFVSPYKYTPSAEKLANYSPMWQDRYASVENACYIPDYKKFRLYYFGGLSLLRSAIDTSFMASNPKDRKDPVKMYEDCWHYYMDNDNANWNSMLSKAGY